MVLITYEINFNRLLSIFQPQDILFDEFSLIRRDPEHNDRLTLRLRKPWEEKEYHIKDLTQRCIQKNTLRMFVGTKYYNSSASEFKERFGLKVRPNNCYKQRVPVFIFADIDENMMQCLKARQLEQREQIPRQLQNKEVTSTQEDEGTQVRVGDVPSSSSRTSDADDQTISTENLPLKSHWSAESWDNFVSAHTTTSRTSSQIHQSTN